VSVAAALANTDMSVEGSLQAVAQKGTVLCLADSTAAGQSFFVSDYQTLSPPEPIETGYRQDGPKDLDS
jgi:hypothetical protein